VGTQTLQNFLPIADTYQQIARHAEVVLFAYEDNSRLPDNCGINWVSLHQEHQLCREWFVIVSHKDYSRAIIAEEISEGSGPTRERSFRGMRTSNPDIVRELDQKLQNLVSPK
jgi:DICT domain-containing protein